MTGPDVLGETVSFSELVQPLAPAGVFTMFGWHVWCGSAAQGPGGAYYLLFSRWPESAGFEAWATHSEIAVAVSVSPDGPYEFVDTVFPHDDARWDQVTHNPSIVTIDGRYYLYYMGTHGPALGDNATPADSTWWTYRNNQRIGVAVADHPAGPWARLDQPVLEAGAPGSWDSLLINNPSVCSLPDGRVLMMYKGVARATTGDVVSAGVAIAPTPLGPFERQSRPSVSGEHTGQDWSVEDPYLWRDGDRLLAIMKDFGGALTGTGESSLALLESADGLTWRPCALPLAMRKRLRAVGRGVIEPFRLERPQLLIVDGEPVVFLCAVLETPGSRSYNAQVRFGRSGA